VYSRTFETVPKFAVMNKDQKKFIVTTVNDALLVDFDKNPRGHELDIDETTDLSSIKAVLAGEKNFYILANKQT